MLGKYLEKGHDGFPIYGGQCILHCTCHFIRQQFTSSAVTMSFSNL